MVVKRLYHLSIDCTRAFQEQDVNTPQLLLNEMQKGEMNHSKTQQIGTMITKERDQGEQKLPIKNDDESFFEYKQRVAKQFWDTRIKHASLKLAYVEYLMLFNKARKERDTEQAIALGTILTVIQPKKYSSYQLLAGLFLNQKQSRDLAIDVYREALTYHKNNPKVYKDLAKVYQEMGKYKLAIREYDQLLELPFEGNYMESSMTKETMQETVDAHNLRLLRNSKSRVFNKLTISFAAYRQQCLLLAQRAIHYQRIACLMKLGYYEQIVIEYELFVNLFPTTMVGLTTKVVLAMLGQQVFPLRCVIPAISSIMNRIIEGDSPHAMAPLLASICHAYGKDAHLQLRIPDCVTSYKQDLTNVLTKANIPHTLLD